MNKIKIAIAGYGNVGRGVALAASQNADMELKYVLSRREPKSVDTAGMAEVIHISDAEKIVDETDVLIICSGSATDLPVQGPQLAAMFNTVDSFDNHAHIPEYFSKIDNAARLSGHLSLISCGWDPGMFSVNRVYSDAILPCGRSYTFWGRGVSQGHSDAIRRIPGVLRGVQYTVPIESAVNEVREGNIISADSHDRHRRECYVVAADGADLGRIENDIKEMPDYFKGYDTTVYFISEEEFNEKHTGMPHGGFVLRSGETASGKKQIVEYNLKLESNPEFTASVLVACARAAARLARDGSVGAKTMLDVPPAYFSQHSSEELLKNFL